MKDQKISKLGVFGNAGAWRNYNLKFRGNNVIEMTIDQIPSGDVDYPGTNLPTRHVSLTCSVRETEKFVKGCQF